MFNPLYFSRSYSTAKNNKVNLFYRMCDSCECFSRRKRDFDIPKINLIKKCQSTIANAIAIADKKFEIKIITNVIADNCSDELIDFTKETFANSISTFHRPANGYGNSGTFKYQIQQAAKLPDNEICFFLEDDYIVLNNHLFALIPQAIEELSKFGLPASIMPDDYPDRYKFISDSVGVAKDAMVATTSVGNFMRIGSSTLTFITTAEVIKKNLSSIMRIAPELGIGENKSINLAWRNNSCMLFHPLCAWTAHTQYLHLFPRYIDTDKISQFLSK